MSGRAARTTRFLGATRRRFPRVYWRLRNGFALAEWVVRRMLGRAEDRAYDPAFYASHREGDWQGFARTMLAFASARRVVDVGCGDGNLLAALRRVDPSVALLGLEGSSHAVAGARARGLPVEQCDLAVPGSGESSVAAFAPDLAVSLEVAEHLPPWRASELVALLARAPVVVFSAAQPNQGGRLHLNEQPWHYWVQKFAAHGMRVHPQEEAFRASVASLGLAPWYRDNVRLLVRSG